jgi:branched-chain amino acid transport system ATP-binding protein
VILLDEPTAGMSKSETTRFIHLIKEVTEGKTLLTVEHDMGVVFGLADKIAVVVYGEVIAFDTPEKVRANAACRRPTWAPPCCRCAGGRDTDMLKIDNLHAYYGKSHVLHGVHLRGAGRARSWPAGPQRLGPLHHRQGHHGPGGLPGHACNGRASDLNGKKAYEIAHLGLGYVPENRDIFPNLTVHQNLMLGQKGSGKGSRWSFDDMYDMFPRLKERQHTEAGVLSGGEQQMLTLCRTLMGDPDLIIIDEPTEGLAPKIVELVGEYLQKLKAAASRCC